MPSASLRQLQRPFLSVEAKNHARQAATYSPLFGNRIATKVQIFALT